MFPSQDPVGVHITDNAPHTVVDEPTVWIPLSDGTQLAARLWRPDVTEAVPAVIEMIPYRRRDGTLPVDERIHPYLAGHGIAGLRIDLRGCGDSEGFLLDEYLPREQQDAEEIIQWVAEQAWCNGSVGMTGLSWGGFNSLQVAAKQPPALKAIVAVGATVDRYNDDIHYKNGCLLNENFGWGSSLTAFTTRPPDPEVLGERWRAQWLERLEQLHFYAEPWLAHSHYDDYWRHGSVKECYADIRVPVMIVTGWNDLYVNAVPALLDHLEVPCRAIAGPWGHHFPHMATPGPVVDYLGETLRWWQRWLSDDASTAHKAEKSYLAFLKRGDTPNPWAEQVSGRWVEESQWPSPRVQSRSLFLTERGLSGEAAPAPIRLIHSPLDTGAESGEWVPHSFGPEIPGDQRPIDAGSVVFDSVPLAQPFELLGSPSLSLHLSSNRPSGHLIARLCDVAPDGASELVSIGVLNLAHRQGNAEPSPMPIDESTELRITLDHVGHCFPTGHRIRLSLSTAYWPLIWPSVDNPCLQLSAKPAQLNMPHYQDQGFTQALPESVDRADIPPPSRCRIRREASAKREVQQDVANGTTRVEIVDDLGEVYFEDHALVTSATKSERYEIDKRDPLSATASVHWQFVYQRGDWHTRTDTHTTMCCDSTHYTISAHIKAFEDDTLCFERTFEHTIKRGF